MQVLILGADFVIYMIFLGRTNAKAFDAVITGKISICIRTSMLFDHVSTYCYMSFYDATNPDFLCESLTIYIHVATLIWTFLVVD